MRGLPSQGAGGPLPQYVLLGLNPGCAHCFHSQGLQCLETWVLVYSPPFHGTLCSFSTSGSSGGLVLGHFLALFSWTLFMFYFCFLCVLEMLLLGT